MVLKEQLLLDQIYQHYLKTGKREYGVNFSNMQDRSDIYSILNNLNDDGFIEYTAEAMGFCVVKLTTYGIQFVENNFKFPKDIPAISGNNNIIITGANNTVSGNYNEISVNISNSDLPEECKNLIQSFLFDMQNPHLTPEKRHSKIKTFLSEISSGTISGVAASGLSTLLFHLLSKI